VKTVSTLNRLFDHMPGRILIATCLSMVGVIGTIDHLTGSEMSLSIFYLMPIGTAAWYGNRKLGMWMSVVSAIVWVVTDFTAEHTYRYAIMPFWNATVRFGFFVIVSHLVSSQRSQLRREIESALIDHLTGIKNTKGFLSETDILWDLATRHGHTSSLAYLDLDNFKDVNDTYGHAEGDAVLTAVAAAVADSVRSTDVVGRLGGDEFALFLPETSSVGAAHVLQRVQERVRHLARERGWPIALSVGVLVVRPPYPLFALALRAADELMYRAKRAGKNHVVIEPAAPQPDAGLAQRNARPDYPRASAGSRFEPPGGAHWRRVHLPGAERWPRTACNSKRG
jgi:diguanylate cyclase (GGDEF)-like protein